MLNSVVTDVSGAPPPSDDYRVSPARARRAGFVDRWWIPVGPHRVWWADVKEGLSHVE